MKLAIKDSIKVVFKIAFKSLWHRRETVGLTILSLALSVFLLLGVDRLREAAEQSFTQTISQTDLIVGARTGPSNLVLATVFNRGVFANNIPFSVYEDWRKNPAVKWTIPLILGDGHRGFRVVGTNRSFFDHYRFQGNSQLQLSDGDWFEDKGHGERMVVLGAEVARQLTYSLGSPVVLEHGVTREVGVLKHNDDPFTVSGILEATGTIIDQSLFVSMDSLAHIHGEELEEAHLHPSDHKSRGAGMEVAGGHHRHHPDPVKGSNPLRDKTQTADSTPTKEGDEPVFDGPDLTGFFLGLKNKIDILNLQRAINDYRPEPLSAVIPSVVMNDLWQMLGQIETSLKVLGFCILVVSLLSMVSNFLASFNERRREMAILRSLGVGPLKIAGLLVVESFLMMLTASVLGLFLLTGLSHGLHHWIRAHYGLVLSKAILAPHEFKLLLFIFGGGILAALVPAYRVFRRSLKDGLMIR